MTDQTERNVVRKQAPLIMVVDDDLDFLEIQRHVIEAGGYRVSCASDPHDALRKMERDRPEVVVTDLMMTSLDSGFSLARRLKRDPRFKNIPVVIVTAIGGQRGYDFVPRSPEDLEAMNADAFLASCREGFCQGFDVYIAKPL